MKEDNLILNQVMKLILKDLLTHSVDDVLWMSTTTDKEQQCVTYRDAILALLGKDKEWVKDDLIENIKRLEKYKKSKKNLKSRTKT